MSELSPLASPLDEFFQKAAFARITASGFSISPVCRSDLERLIGEGVQRLPDDEQESQRLVNSATTALEKIISGMMAEARAENTLELGEWTLKISLRKLCPLPPWVMEPCD